MHWLNHVVTFIPLYLLKWLKRIYNPFGWRHRIIALVWFLYILITGIYGSVVVMRFRSRYFNRLPEEKQLKYHVFRRLDEHTFIPFYHIIGSFLIMPLRLIVLTFVFWLFMIIVWTLEMIRRVFPKISIDGSQDIAKLKMTRYCYSALHLLTACVCRMMLFLFGVSKINESMADRRNIIDRNALGTVVSNHVSLCDVLYFIARIFPSFIAKHSVKTSVIGPVANMLKCIYINRGDPIDRIAAIKEVEARQETLELEWKTGSPLPTPPLVVFPEGSSSSGRSMIGFKRGAFVALRPVTPVVFVYRCPGFNLSLDTLRLHDWLILAMSNPFFSTMDVYWMKERGPEEVKCPITGQELRPEEILPKYVSEVKDDMESCLLKYQHWVQDIPKSWTEEPPSIRLKHECRVDLEQIKIGVVEKREVSNEKDT